MAELKWLKVLTFSVASGGEKTDSYVPRENVLVKRIYATERKNENLSNVFADIDFMGVDLTDGTIPVAILGSDSETAFVLERVLVAGNAITFKIINKLGVSIDLDIVLECHTPT